MTFRHSNLTGGFMRYPLTVSIVVLALVSIARADPTTQPACDVYLTPFTALGGDNSLDWAGKAVAQNLLTDLVRSKFHPLAADKALPTTADAQAAAKAAGAKFLITGTYQTAELQVRFNGQIFDVATGNVVGALTATGSPRDLFALEDSLSAQAIAQLTQQPAVVRNNKPAGPVPAALAPAVVVQVIQPPAVAQAGAGSSYQGSALQDYVDSNRTPSTDYSQQVQDAQDRDTYGSYNFGNGGFYNGGFYSPYLGGYGIGSYGFGLVYSVSSGGFGSGFGPRFGFHHDHDRGSQR
jgi:TolB-like protein